LEQEDFIKRQIDQLGRVLGTILADLIGLKAQGQISEGIEAADKELKKKLDLNVDNLTSISTEKFIKTLQEGKKLSNDNFDKLVDILFLLTEELDERNTDNEKKNKLYERSLTIYEHLEDTSSTYSFDRHFKIEKIINAL
jgi:hypothetical protein